MIGSKTALIICFLTMFLVSPARVAVASDADAWSMQGHDPQRTGRSSVAGPGKLTLKWSYDFAQTMFQGNTAPVVGPDGTIYVPSETNFYAINPDGTLKWQKTYQSGVNSWNMKNAPALSPDGSAIYVLSGWDYYIVTALSTQNGDVLWNLPIQSPDSIGYSSFCVDSHGTIYVGTYYSSLYAIKADGTLKWRYDSPYINGIYSSPAADPSGNVYFVENLVGLVALDAGGNRKWTGSGFGGDGWPTPAIGPDGTVYVAGEFNTSTMRAFNTDGTLKWQRTDIPSPWYQAGVAISSEGSTVYTARNSGQILALNSSTGATIWTKTIADDFFGGSPALSGNGILYLAGWSDYVYAVSAADGTLLDKYYLNNGAPHWGPQSPALGPDGTLYVVTSGNYGYSGGTVPARLYAFEAPAVTTAYPLTVSRAGTGGGTITSNPAGISCGADCSKNYASGTSVSLDASPDAGSTFAGWSGDCSGTGTCTLTMDASKNAVATFNQAGITSYSLAVINAGNGSGTITSNPAGINCGSDCSENFVSGTSVELNAAPSSSSTFAGWSGDCSGSADTCAITIDGAKTATATFDAAAPAQTGGVVALPRTGQTRCYNASGAEITCPDTGQDGEFASGGAWPVPRFADNGDQTMTDKLTGLIWVKDAGSPASGTCTNANNTWWTALDYVTCLNAANYLGHNDWRMPNVNELESLVNEGETDNALWLGQQGFTNTKSDIYWTSTTNVFYTPGNVWTVHMGKGQVNGNTKYANLYAWPVRTGQDNLSSIWKTGQKDCYAKSNGAVTACTGLMQDGEFQTGVAWPAQRFIDNNDQTITDGLTGLTWTKDTATPGTATCAPGAAKSWQNALDHLKCLNTNSYLGHNDWRLPNRKELMSLIDRSQYPLALPPGHPFINTGNITYWWSSTTFTGDGTKAWNVSKDGALLDYSKTYDRYVWPVRGQSSLGDIKLTVSKAGTGSGTVTSSPAGIDCGPFCAAGFTSNTAVTLSAVPSEGSTFAGWTGDCTNTTGDCAITLSTAKNVTAAFGLVPDFGLSSASLTSIKGSSGQADIAFTASGGFSSTVTLTYEYIGTAPSDASVAITPSSVTPASGGITVTLKLTTGQTSEGSYTIRLKATSGDLTKTVDIPVTVAPIQGYAILVEGGGQGQYTANYTATLDDIYKRMVRRYFREDDIYYLNHEGTGHPGVNDIPSKQNVQNAITAWAQQRLTQNGIAPLYIILAGPGDKGKFYISQGPTAEYITPDDLGGWMASLEGAVPADPSRNLNIVSIIASNYSGAFIQNLSKAGRIILTSSTEAEYSIQGPSTGNEIFGDFFTYYLFGYLENGQDLKDAFGKAVDDVRKLMQCSACGFNKTIGAFNVSYQNPLMDDNGDGKASWDITQGGDGQSASKIKLGLGTGQSMPQWKEAMPTYTMAPGSGDSLAAWAKPVSDVSSSWTAVRKPSFAVPGTAGSDQLMLDMPGFTGTYDSGARKWEYALTGLTEPGTYGIYYYAIDASENITPPMTGTVYVNTDGNRPPSTFTLVGPGAPAATPEVLDVSDGMLIFKWNKAQDPDSDPITYTLKIYEENGGQIGNEVKRYERIKQEGIFINGYEEKRDDGITALFTPLQTFWWLVEAIDNKGAITVSDAFRFKRIFTHPATGIITGVIYSDADYSKIVGAAISSSISPGITASFTGGTFMITIPTGTTSVTTGLSVSLTGHPDTTISDVSISPGEVKVINIGIPPTTASDTLTLNPGWNFISFSKLQAQPTPIETVFADVSSNVRVIWGFNNQTKVWLKYQPSAMSNELSTIDIGKGYWVYMNDTATLTPAGQSANSQTIALFTGWNLIGYNGADNTSVGDSLSGLSDKWIIIWNWENGQWSVKHRTISYLSTQPLNSFSKGKAYWIKVNADTQWTQ